MKKTIKKSMHADTVTQNHTLISNKKLTLAIESFLHIHLILNKFSLYLILLIIIRSEKICSSSNLIVMVWVYHC